MAGNRPQENPTKLIPSKLLANTVVYRSGDGQTNGADEQTDGTDVQTDEIDGQTDGIDEQTDGTDGTDRRNRHTLV